MVVCNKRGEGEGESKELVYGFFGECFVWGRMFFVILINEVVGV